jgi:hypothetical protein
VVVGPRHDELIGLEVLVKDHLTRLWALDPEIVRYLALRRQEAANLRPDDVVNPIHALRLSTTWPDRAAMLALSFMGLDP